MDHVRGKQEIFLESRWLGGGAVDLIQGGKSRGGPDDEASKVTAWCKLEKVERENGGGLDAGDVAESADELFPIFVWVVDDQRSTSLAVTAASEFSFAGAKFA